jgi:hypothetical protein
VNSQTPFLFQPNLARSASRVSFLANARFPGAAGLGRQVTQGDLYAEYVNEFVASSIALVASGPATDWARWDSHPWEIADFQGGLG